MSAQAVTNLDLVPQKLSFDAGYYVTEILQKSLHPNLAWDTSTGSVLTKKWWPGCHCQFSSKTAHLRARPGKPSNGANRT